MFDVSSIYHVPGQAIASACVHVAGAWYICGHLRSTILKQQFDCCNTAGLSSDMKRCLSILINLCYCSLVL